MQRSIITGGLFLFAVVHGFAQSSLPSAATSKPDETLKVAQAGDARCRKEVKDYVGTLAYLRQAAGAQIGDRVAGGYVTEAELDKVVSTQGHCAAARMLRDKRTPR